MSKRMPRRAFRWFSGLVVAAMVVGVAWSAYFSKGYETQRIAPNDGTVWVANSATGHVGRLNKPAQGLDTVLQTDSSSQSHQIDTIQAGSTVLAWDRVGNKITPVDVQKGSLVKEQGASLPGGSEVVVNGGSIAVFEPSSGKLWAARANESTGVAVVEKLRATADPIAEVDIADDAVENRGAAVAISDDGVISLVGSAGEVVTLTPDAAAGFAQAKRSLDAKLRNVQAAYVGSGLVIVDTELSLVLLPSGTSGTLPAKALDARLQASGPDTKAVYLTTTSDLVAINLESGQPTVVWSGAKGTPTAPVTGAGCVFAAWPGTPGVAVRQCGSDVPAVVELEGDRDLQSPQVRVNQTTAVLNDNTSGKVWDLITGKRLDNWEALIPPSKKESNKVKDVTTNQLSKRPPKAIDDNFGVRPGVASVVHPLDNDDNPAGNVLSILSVTKPAGASVTIAADGQTLQVSLGGGSSTAKFGYTIDDGKGNTSSAQVTLKARPNGNSKPVLRKHYEPTTYGVAERGRVEIPIISDWRDPESDPVVLASASESGKDIPVSPDGQIHYTADSDPGLHTLKYKVSDGDKQSVGSIKVNVLATDSTTTERAKPLPDVAKGEVGRPITITPLDNDLPGADPTTPRATLAIAADVVAPPGVTVKTNVKSGTVTVTGESANTYFLTYAVSYGAAAYARGTIRVDIAKAKDRNARPVATVDQAVVHEQQPVLVDVLANDYAPSGRLLAVQSAVPADADQFKVAVIRGRWVRVQPLKPKLPALPARIKYTITDGPSDPVTGEIAVKQLPRPENVTPTPADDYVTVRSNDGTIVPVLDNDTTPTGEKLRLVSQVSPDSPAGVLPVRAADGEVDKSGKDAGRAYVSGEVLRFQAPSVKSQTVVTVDYIVEDTEGNRAGAKAFVTVLPQPTANAPDRAPSPADLEARVVSGDSLTINIPTTGADPDGDSVTLLGLESAPTLGRVLATTPSSLTYQAYPTSHDTDEFSYVVQDRYGKRGVGTVRVAVLPPGDPQPPVAIDDVVTTSPARTVTLNPVANDIVAIGDRVEMNPLSRDNTPVPEGVTVSDKGDAVTVPAPKEPGESAVRYSITGSSGEPTVANVRVRAQEDANVPPIARNGFAAPKEGADTVRVNVLGNAVDPDGNHDDISITQIFDTPGASIDGDSIVLPVADRPQIVGFEIEDGDGGRASAIVFVPTVGTGLPVLKKDALIRVDRDSTARVALSDLVQDPSGKDVILTTVDKISASPSEGLSVRNDGDDALSVTSHNGYVGPGSVTFEVTNGDSAADPKGVRALLSVPVQIGPETPVLRCPPTSIAVVQGGQSRPISIPELCHVWTPEPGAAADLKFVGHFPNSDPGLQVSPDSNGRLVVTATGAASPNKAAKLEVTIPDTQTKPAVITVLVTRANAPVLSPVSITGLKAGGSRTVNVLDRIESPLGNPTKRALSVARVSGPELGASISNESNLTVSAPKDAKGRSVYTLEATDIAGPAAADRVARTLVTVDLLGHPDKPGTPYLVGDVASGRVTIGWSAPANNGLPIEYYRVSGGSDTQDCPASPCTITGLKNGSPTQFTVVAHNGVGDSEPSDPSQPIMADSTPGVVGSPSTSDPGDGSLTVSWTAPQVDGSPVDNYLISWPGGSAETRGATTFRAQGLDNNAVTRFSIKAHNKAGWGPSTSVTGQSAGTPSVPQGIKVEPIAAASRPEQTTARVSWRALPSANGPGTVTYTVSWNGPSDQCKPTTGTSCDVTVPNDGTTYSFRVRASNNLFSSDSSEAASFSARGKPGSITGTSLIAGKGQAKLVFDVPKANASKVVVSCEKISPNVTNTDCGSWDFTSAQEGQTTTPRTVSWGAIGERAVVKLTASNGNDAGDTSSTTVSSSSVVYGGLDVRVDSAASEVSGAWIRPVVRVNTGGLPTTLKVTEPGGYTSEVSVDGATEVVSKTLEWGRFGYNTSVNFTATVTRDVPGGDSDTDSDEGEVNTENPEVEVTKVVPSSACPDPDPNDPDPEQCNQWTPSFKITGLTTSDAPDSYSCKISTPTMNSTKTTVTPGQEFTLSKTGTTVGFEATTATTYTIGCSDDTGEFATKKFKVKADGTLDPNP